MWEIVNEFIKTVTETAINLAELGFIFGVAGLFFKGIAWIADKAKALVSSD